MNPAWSPSDELLSRFLREDCSSAESHSVQAWLAQSPQHARRLEGLRRVLTTAIAGDWDVDGMWARVRTQTVDANRPTAGHPAHKRNAPRVSAFTQPWRVPIAASILLALLGTAVWLDLRNRVPATVAALPDVIYQTRRGQSASVQLSDGSRVRLAPESRLAIPATFGDSNRELTLEGEAVFDVRHDATTPFRVRTRNAVTEDIGTRFGVRAYRSDSRVTVTVAEGAVTLGLTTHTGSRATVAQGMLLRRGDLGTLDARGAIAVVHGASVTRAFAWTEGRLSFSRQPLAEVLESIARWYDLDIRLTSSALAAHSVTAEFSTQSASEMLAALALAVEATVERDGQRVILRPR